jgi:hypothetical protein
MRFLSDDNNQTNPDTTPKPGTAWEAGWGVHHQTASAWDFNNDNDGAGPESEDDDGGGAWLSDPSNADEQETETDLTPVAPKDRRCWTPRTLPTETPRGGW